MPCSLRPISLVTTIIALLLVPATAGAVGWVAGPPLSGPGVLSVSPVVTITPSGERIVAWQQRKANDRFNSDTILIRTAPAGSDFGPAQKLAIDFADGVSLTSGADGTVALVWESGTTLHIARRAPGETTFTEVQPLAVDRVNSPPAVAVSGGDIDVAFDNEVSVNNVETTAIRAARLAAGSSAITPIPGSAMAALDAVSFNQNTQPSHELLAPTIAVAGGGTVFVAWEDLADSATDNPGGVTTIRRATLAPGAAAFGAPTPVDATTDAGFFRAEDESPRLAAGGGRVVLAWARATQSQVAYEDLVAASPIQTISSLFAFGVHIGLSDSGDLTLGWEAFLDKVFGDSVVATAIAPGAAPTDPTRLTPSNTDRRLDAFVTGVDGSALAITDHNPRDSFGSAASDVQASFRAPGQPFGALEEISGPQDRIDDQTFDLASGAVGPGGTAIAAWAADDGAGTLSERIFFSQRDAIAPAIGAVTIPPTAGVAAPVAMAASATDTQSPVTITWDFGDGSQATGAAVTHAYGSPGTYTVTITATDGEANSATRSATIVVPGPGSTTKTTTTIDDHTAPVVSKLSRTHARFRVAGTSTATIAAHRTAKHKAPKTPTATTFALNLDERATLIVDITGKVKAHRVAPGTLVRAGRGPGKVSIPFSGRIGATRLAPGSYVASVTAIDAAGNRSRPRTVTFTVVAR